MPVGTGKTEVFLAVLEAELAAGALGRALILAHRTEIVDQPAERIRKHFPALAALGVGIVQADRNECHAPIVCGMVQTLTTPARRDALLAAGPITHLVIDEAHHGSADTYVWLTEFLEQAYPELRVLGVTATPRGGAGKRLGLEHIFPETAYTLSLPEAIKLGVLSPFRALGASLPVSFRDVGIVNGDYEAGKATWRGIKSHGVKLNASFSARQRLLAAPSLSGIVSEVAERTGVPAGSRLREAAYASGEKVVAHRRLARSLARHDRKIAAIEMESLGVADACRRSGAEFMVLKAVTDLADRKKSDDLRGQCCGTRRARSILAPRRAAATLS